MRSEFNISNGFGYGAKSKEVRESLAFGGDNKDTASTSGIGRAAAIKLAEQGANLIISGRNVSRGQWEWIWNECLCSK